MKIMMRVVSLILLSSVACSALASAQERPPANRPQRPPVAHPVETRTISRPAVFPVAPLQGPATQVQNYAQPAPTLVSATSTRDEREKAVFFQLGLLLVFVILPIYLIPSIIAFRREHASRWLILAINLFGGLTGFGWVLAFLWSLHGLHRPKEGSYGGQSGLNVLANDFPPESMSTSKADELTKLKKLMDDGAITSEEYSSLKSRVLTGSS